MKVNKLYIRQQEKLKPSQFLVDLSKETNNQKKDIGENRKKRNYEIFNIVKKLTFYPLILTFFKMFFFVFWSVYKISYNVGWFCLFLVRFIYFSVIFSFNFLKNQITSLFTKNKEEQVVLNNRTNFLRKIVFKKILSFVTIVIIIVLPFKFVDYYRSLNIEVIKGRVLGASEEAVREMVNASKFVANMEFDKAGENFVQAQKSFQNAQEELKQINDFLFVLANLLPSKKAKMASNAKLILEAGKIGANLGFTLNQGIEVLVNEKDLDKKIDLFSLALDNASVSANQLNYLINKIDFNSLPNEYKEEFVLMQDKIDDLNQILQDFDNLIKKAKIFLGFKYDRRYLLIFQNNAELRATGGFIGSYAIVDFRKGKIVNIEIPTGGGYDTEAGMREAIISPEPLHLINPRWYFWDSNWWPDWPTSARQIMKFYEKSGGSTVDGVISLTPTVFEEVLKITGPIDMREGYGIIFDSDNFWLETQRIVEYQKYKKCATTTESFTAECKKEKPKKIIKDLFNKVLKILPQKLNNKENLLDLIKILNKNLNEKQILVYFNNEDLQQIIKQYNWEAEIKDFPYDYLMVVDTNIGGGKSDRKVYREINHLATIESDGSIIDTLTIKINHNARKGEEFVGVRNVDWLRVYVPKGSILISASGFNPPPKKLFEEPGESWKYDDFILTHEKLAKRHQLSGTLIYSEFNKTVFANWVQTDPEQSSIIRLKYKLPFKIKTKSDNNSLWDKILSNFNKELPDNSFYALLIQKQPGTKNYFLNAQISFPTKWNIQWCYPEINKCQINEQLNFDKYQVVIFNN